MINRKNILKRSDPLKKRAIYKGVGHIVIIGAGKDAGAILEELAMSVNAKKNRADIVVIGDAPRKRLYAQLRPFSRALKSKLICATGGCEDFSMYDAVSLSAASSVIIAKRDSDLETKAIIETLLAYDARRAGKFTIAAAFYDTPSGYKDGERLNIIYAPQYIGRITAQSSRQPGLTLVYEELFSFNGNEVYFYPAREFAGKTYLHCLRAFANATVIGIFSGDAPLLNPPMHTIINPGDAFILIAEDGNSISQNPPLIPAPMSADIAQNAPEERRLNETFLIIGWNPHADIMLRELDHYAPNNSKALIASESRADESAFSQLKKLTVSAQPIRADTQNSFQNLPLEWAEHIIILPEYSAESDKIAAIKKSKDLFYSLRYILETNRMRRHIVLQTDDSADVKINDPLTECAVGCDVVPKIMAQIISNRRLIPIFQELTTQIGSEIYIRPAEDYVSLQRPVNFYTVIEAARRKNETAIGYFFCEETRLASRSRRVYLNPPKDLKTVLSANDKIIVIAREY